MQAGESHVPPCYCAAGVNNRRPICRRGAFSSYNPESFIMLIANAALPVWQAIFLIFLSFGSLIIALYCLLFMVPLKKFVQRIESLGGGMEGIKSHLSGIEAYFEKELQRMESSRAERIDHLKTVTEERFEAVERKMQDMEKTLQRQENTGNALGESMESMQQELQETMSTCANMERRLREMRRDMSVQGEETEGKLQKQVRESFYELEATMLSTLEVLRDELLPPKKDGTPHDSASSFSPVSRKKGPHAGEQEPTDSKIISAGPLFSRSEPPDRDPDKSEDDDNGR